MILKLTYSDPDGIDIVYTFECEKDCDQSIIEGAINKTMFDNMVVSASNTDYILQLKNIGYYPLK